MERRALGGANTIILSGLVNNREFGALLTHECGHVVDIGSLTGNPRTGETDFYDGTEPIFADDPSVSFYSISWQTAVKKKARATGSDFVSGYAMSDIFEDFAEHFAYYALHNEDFLRLAQKNKVLMQKYQWMKNNVFKGTPVIASGQYERTAATPPWDVTKLPYQWLQ